MQRLFFDIETRADPSAVLALPEPQAPANYKDPAKIESYIAEKRAAQIRDAALAPDTGYVSAIALTGHAEFPPVARLIADPETRGEADLLRFLWEAFAESDGRAVGYNILGFDLPFLLRRSFAAGLRPTIIPHLARYQTEPITDLYGILYNWQPGKSLKTVAALYGLPNRFPGLDSGDVAGMGPAAEREYVVNDVEMVVALWRRMDGIYWQSLA